jgi:hypothetical protein
MGDEKEPPEASTSGSSLGRCVNAGFDRLVLTAYVPVRAEILDKLVRAKEHPGSFQSDDTLSSGHEIEPHALFSGVDGAEPTAPFWDPPVSLMPHGSQSGYSFILKNPYLDLKVSSYDTDRVDDVRNEDYPRPTVILDFSAHLLWSERLGGQHPDTVREFVEWLGSDLAVDGWELGSLGVSRVDLCGDFAGDLGDRLRAVRRSSYTFDEAFKSDSKSWNSYTTRGVFTGVDTGKNPKLRIYHKPQEIRDQSNKSFFYELWDMEPPEDPGDLPDVWRVEFQLSKETLDRFGYRSYESIFHDRGEIWRELTSEKFTFLDNEKLHLKNRYDIPTDPVWNEAVIPAWDDVPTDQTHTDPIRVPDRDQLLKQVAGTAETLMATMNGELDGDPLDQFGELLMEIMQQRYDTASVDQGFREAVEEIARERGW